MTVSVIAGTPERLVRWPVGVWSSSSPERLGRRHREPPFAGARAEPAIKTLSGAQELVDGPGRGELVEPAESGDDGLLDTCSFSAVF